jgi:hypothetical protein
VERVDRIKFCTATSCLSYPPEDMSRWSWNGRGDAGNTYQNGKVLSDGTFPIKAGWWYNVTITYTKAPAPVPVVGAVPPRTQVPPQAVMYINGVKVAESTPPTPPLTPSTFSPPTATATSLLMGSDGTKVLKGRIDDVRLYNVALKRDDVMILGQGCPPGTFDPKTGKVSLPCVVETDYESAYIWGVSDGSKRVMVGAWQVDLAAVPPKANPNNYGSDEKNMRFTLAKSTPMPLPMGIAMAPRPNDWVPSEYPWGALVAVYDADSYDADRWAYDLTYLHTPSQYSYAQSFFDFEDLNYLEIPGVKVPSAFGAPVMDCYGADLYYDPLNSRFELGYIWSEGPECNDVKLDDWGVSKRPAKVEEAAAATPAVATP